MIFIISEVIPLLVSLQLHTLQHFAGSGVERALPTPRGSITSRSNSRCGYRDIGGSASNSRSNSIVNNKDSDDFRPSDGRRSTLSPLADGLIDYTDFGSEQGPTHETIMFSGEPYSIEEYQRRTNSVNAALNFSRFYKSNSSLFPSISSIFSPVNSTTDTDSRTEERKPTQTYQCRNVLSSDDEDSSSYVTADFRSTNSSNNHKAI